MKDQNSPDRQAVFKYPDVCTKQGAKAVPHRGTGAAVYSRTRRSQGLPEPSGADSRKIHTKPERQRREKMYGNGRPRTIPKRREHRIYRPGR